MIKLERYLTPICLEPTKVKQLTDEFKKTGQNVWNIDLLKETLLLLSNGKCAYCECNLKCESKYMEVEHYEDKQNNPDKVLEWDNLLPSCKRCNGKKGTHDVNQEPIINPFKVHPTDHLKMYSYRFKGKTQIGNITIDVIDLNNSERAVKQRFEIGEMILSLVNEIKEKLEIYKSNPNIRNKNKLIGLVEGLLLECIPNAQYSATSATVLQNDNEYKNLRSEMIAMNLWSIELEELHIKSDKIKFEII